MNQISRMLAGIAGGAMAGIITARVLSSRHKVAKRGRSLSDAIDKKIADNKTDLQQTKQILETELRKVNATLEMLSMNFGANQAAN